MGEREDREMSRDPNEGVVGLDSPPTSTPLREMSQEELYSLRVDLTSFGSEELRHRFGYHKPANLAIQEKHRVTRQVLMDVASIFDKMLPSGRAKSMVLTSLEEACMWANKAIAEMSPVVDESPISAHPSLFQESMDEHTKESFKSVLRKLNDMLPPQNDARINQND